MCTFNVSVHLYNYVRRVGICPVMAIYKPTTIKLPLHFDTSTAGKSMTLWLGYLHRLTVVPDNGQRLDVMS